MENQLKLAHDAQKESWNRFSPVWRKSNDLFMEFLRPVRDEMIRVLKPNGTDVILDVASGTGEPGLAIASRLNGGMVIITDFSEEMLTLARDNAGRQRISNIDTWACDACDLPFADNTFDAISCRLGFVFFHDITRAVQEMLRVLKPGGRIAASVWNVPEKNHWLSSVQHTLQKNATEVPDLFRCAQEGHLAGLFQQAGLNNTRVTETTLGMTCPTSEVYRHVVTEIVVPGIPVLSNAADDIRSALVKSQAREARRSSADGRFYVDASALVIYGNK